MRQPGTQVFQGCLVHASGTQNLCVLEDAVIGVHNGKIIFVDGKNALPGLLERHGISPDQITVLSRSQFLMPGFVDCHAHASQFSFMGTGTELALMDWLHTYTFPTEAKFKDDSKFARDVYSRCVTRTLKSGTTTVCYFATIDCQASLTLVEEIEKQGQRAFVGKVNMDSNSPDSYVETLEQSVEQTERFIDEMAKRRSELVTACITPRFAVSCSMPLMQRLAHLAKTHHLPIQTHVSENDKEIELVAELFPGSSSYTDVYRTAGLLSNRTLLAHGIHLTDQELDIVKQENCGICHCPNSNFTLSSGVMDLRRLLKKGIKVGLGTDFAGGHSPSMLDTCRRAVEAANVVKERMRKEGLPVEPVTFKEIFRLATLGSSEVMGLDDTIGNFEVGKDFDAILVDVTSHGSPIDVFPSDSREDQIQKFIFLGDDRNILKVFVQGHEVISTPSS